MPKVSIIVPVYKAEKYLNRCVDSILAQTFTDWECFLVDDGSPDHSGRICDEYAARDARIQAIHKENGGVSSARNVALEKIAGKWLTFVDSDDSLYPNALQKWVEVAEQNNLDLIQCHYNREYQEGQISMEETEVLSATQYAELEKWITSVWGTLFKASIIIDHNIRFDENVRLGEDQLFLFNHMQYCKRIKLIGDVLYFYRDNDQSAVNNPKPEYEIASVKAFKDLKQTNLEFVRKQCDYMLYCWFVSLVLKSSVSTKELCNLYKDVELLYCSAKTSKLARIGFHLYTINHLLAIRILRLSKPLYHFLIEKRFCHAFC